MSLREPKEARYPGFKALKAGFIYIGAALHASLSEWRTGVYKKGTFSADTFLDAYTEHVTLLTGIKTQNPRAYHTMMHRLYNEASGTIAPAANLATASDALAHVDFAGMEVD